MNCEVYDKMKIPKNMGHIWIGPNPAPERWMQTWVDRHPDWEYHIYDNDYLKSGSFRTAQQIDEYMRRGSYAGAADLLRYEILFQHGGYMPEADSICLEPIDELLADGGSIYTVYENEFLRGNLVSPIMAAVPGHPFLKEILDRLSKVPPAELGIPWRQTGNLFIAELIEELAPEITIWPSHTLIPVHFEGRVYRGPGKVYAHQLFGSTVGAYETRRGSYFSRKKEKKERKKTYLGYKRMAERMAKELCDSWMASFDVEGNAAKGPGETR